MNRRIVIFALLCVLALGGISAAVHMLNKTGNKEKMNADGCIITQYSDATGRQANCYTITNSGHLIIIDGGWAENVPALRKVIAQNGNHVDAWFISHTHSDHVGAFNVIYADPQGVTIDRIYDNGYDYEFIKEAGEPYDSMGLEPLETFHNLTKDADNIIHLRRDEELEVCGLRIHVYNAFDDIVKQNVGPDLDYQNDGSLCMKITNQEESFLYTGDVKADMNKYLFETYGDELTGDYVQLSHHGNWGFGTEDYDRMNAKAYFADITPEFYESHPIGELHQHLVNAGKQYYDYGTAPNSVELK